MLSYTYLGEIFIQAGWRPYCDILKTFKYICVYYVWTHSKGAQACNKQSCRNLSSLIYVLNPFLTSSHFPQRQAMEYEIWKTEVDML